MCVRTCVCLESSLGTNFALYKYFSYYYYFNKTIKAELREKVTRPSGDKDITSQDSTEIKKYKTRPDEDKDKTKLR